MSDHTCEWVDESTFADHCRLLKCIHCSATVHEEVDHE